MNASKRNLHAGYSPICDSDDLKLGFDHPAYRNLFFRGLGWLTTITVAG